MDTRKIQDDFSNEDLVGERLETRYVPVSIASLWDENPKAHDMGGIIQSITINGFRDPPTYDATLGALVAGNGRTAALGMMEKQGYSAPRGILVHQNTGEWFIPVHFGVDAVTRNMAIAYAIDHNNLTVAGGDLTPVDMAKMWNTKQYMALLNELPVNELPVTIDQDTLELLNQLQDGEGYEDDKKSRDDSDDEDGDEDELSSSDAKVITIRVIDHGVYDDILDAVESLMVENDWDSVTEIE